MKVRLKVDKGPNLGSTYELSLYSYRAIGRSGGVEETVELARVGEHDLDADDIRRVEDHLRERRPKIVGVGAAGQFSAYRRGRDMLLDDDKISRTHAMFFVDEEGPSVVDLRSTNGTYVNGARRAEADLEDGDIVNVGRTRFVVEVCRDV